MKLKAPIPHKKNSVYTRIFLGKVNTKKSMVQPGMAVTPAMIINSMTAGLHGKPLYNPDQNFDTWFKMDYMERAMHLEELKGWNKSLRQNIDVEVQRLKTKAAIEKKIRDAQNVQNQEKQPVQPAA